MMAYPTRDSAEDPGRRFASNMMEVKQGRVTQWWFSGPTNMDMSAPRAAPPPAAAPPNGVPAGPAANSAPPPGAVAATPAAPDYSKFYPQMGNVTISMQSIIPTGTITTREQREANKRLVSSFVDEFFNKKNYAIAEKLVSGSIRNHIAGQPSGAEFVAFARANPEKVAGANTIQVLFLLGEGELVAIGYPVMHNGDPGAWYAQNLARVQDGKIVEWWFSGYPYGAPRFVNPWNKLGYNPRAIAN
jgi:predicted SnoaL-like aldol condensation-catalyzing enzyme